MIEKNIICQQLQELQKMIDASSETAEDMEMIIGQLRQLGPSELPSQMQVRNVFSTVDENFSFLRSILGNGIGLIEGKHDILAGKVQTGVAYIKSISDEELISNQVIKPLLKGKVDFNINFEAILMLIRSTFLSASNVKETNEMEQVVESLLNGDTVLFINSTNTALIIDSRKIVSRSIEKPENESTVLSSMESFVEDLNANCGMIIKRLPTPNLRFEIVTVGVLSHTKLKLIWIEGIANTTIIEEARRRINRINIDNVDGIGVLAELIEDTPLSIFPKYRQTQRPDVVTKNLTDGSFAVLCDNSPFAFLAPISIWDNFKTMDDYAERSTSASYLRLIRYVAFFASVIISPLYLSFVTYNQIIVPQSLAVTISTGREGVPFPTVVELLVMTMGITVIREASLRIPGAVGYFVGSIAAVVIGQATVAAGYVSASIIIIVAVSEISSFALSTTTMVYTSRLINYFFIVLAGMFGMFGLINGVAIILWYVASLESFGVPYLYPLVPFDFAGMKDTFIRLGTANKRLRILAPFNRIRIGNENIIPKKGKQAGE
jgi:spore germination protein KA